MIENGRLVLRHLVMNPYGMMACAPQHRDWPRIRFDDGGICCEETGSRKEEGGREEGKKG